MALNPAGNEPVSDRIIADIVVIGSGPGGAVAATKCAEAGYSVLMVEEGDHLPLDSAPHFSREEMLQKYRNAGVNVAMGRHKIAYVEGCCVGGGSEVNRGIYHRTPDYILETWSRQYDVRNLTPDVMTPHFVACERRAQVEFLPGAAPGISARLHDGAQRLGWHSIEAPRLFHYDGSDGGGRKQSMSETFVPDFLRAGGRLLARTRVSRLNRFGGKWEVQARQRSGDKAGRELTIVADRVFVACGAVQTPALLRRSGITKNIGNSLRFHPMLKLVAEFGDQVNIHGDLDPVHQIKEFEPRFGMGCSISKPAMLGMTMSGQDDHLARIERDWTRMGIYYIQTMGGTAKVRNLPGFRDPLVTVRQTVQDRQMLSLGLKKLAEALFAAGARSVIPGIAGYPALQSVDDVQNLPDVFAGADGSITSVHVFASCPMGENAQICATDSFGRIHRADGLYISDASIFCGPTAVNPQGTVMALAHRNVTEAIERKFQ